MYRFTLTCLLLIALVLSTACGKKVRTAKPARIGDKETGIASWYGHPYHGRRAANGEIYDMEQLTAAHRTLPFGTWVRVKNLSNEREVEVRIQDRGPFIKDRIIDLSKAAAREIELIGPGITKVRVTVIETPKHLPVPTKPPEPAPVVVAGAELFGVQIGAFQDRARAESLRIRMQQEHGSARIIARSASTTVYRVIAGEFQDAADAEPLVGTLRSEFPDCFVVRIDSAPSSELD